MAHISESMRKRLFEQATADGKSFPLKLTLTVGGETVVGFMYADGSFEQGETPTRES